MTACPAFVPGMTGWSEVLLVLALALILFGPKRLPEIAEAMGKSIRKFKAATREATDEVQREFKDPVDGPQDKPQDKPEPPHKD